jgi:hypothetical protein
MLYPSQRSSWAAAATFPSTMRQAAEFAVVRVKPKNRHDSRNGNFQRLESGNRTTIEVAGDFSCIGVRPRHVDPARHGALVAKAIAQWENTPAAARSRWRRGSNLETNFSASCPIRTELFCL